jgi:hypothetical protein
MPRVVPGPTILTASADDAEPETRVFDLACAELTISGDNGCHPGRGAHCRPHDGDHERALRATGITSGHVEAKSENGSVDLAFAKAPDDITRHDRQRGGARSRLPGHDQHRERRHHAAHAAVARPPACATTTRSVACKNSQRTSSCSPRSHSTTAGCCCADPHDSAVNNYLQMSDYPNVFVVGASAFPQNPATTQPAPSAHSPTAQPTAS